MFFDWFFKNFKNLQFETALLEMMDWDEEKLEAFVGEVEKDLELHEHLDLEVFSESLIKKGSAYVPDYYLEDFKTLIKESIESILQEMIDQEKNAMEN
tara:strand:- start:2178 stop:2471 length:294 start_codon:yes stop_codon:yes gene_type:complete